jgi:peptidoglycan/LPS O-acetylase OafA/YrhL
MWLMIFALVVLLAPPPVPATPAAWLWGSPLPWWSYATFTQNVVMSSTGEYGPNWLAITWSLAIEEQFYLLLPFMIRRISPRWLPRVLIACIVAAPLLRYILFRVVPYPEFATCVLMPCRADALMLGVLCAWLIRQESLQRRLITHARWLYLPIGLLAGALAVMALFPTPERFAVWGYLCLAGLYASLLLMTVGQPHGRLAHFFRMRWLRGLGLIAFGVYLFHQAISGLSYGLILNQIPQIRSWADLLVALLALSLTVFILFRVEYPAACRASTLVKLLIPRGLPRGSSLLGCPGGISKSHWLPSARQRAMASNS